MCYNSMAEKFKVKTQRVFLADLPKCLKRAGKNWHAFEDFIDISDVCVIKIINLSEMRKAIPRDTEIFLKIIKKYMSENCKLIFE